MLKATFKKYQLKFNTPVLTSRGKMDVKNGYYLFLSNGQNTGVGECSFIEGLSIDNLNEYENALLSFCKSISANEKPDLNILNGYPSIYFGWETALRDLKNGGRKILFESDFTNGQKAIAINGLVWMGTKDFMRQQISKKIADGFKCIKIKVGAIDFNDELELLNYIRSKFPADLIEIRLDANGAFNSNDVFQKLEKLSKFQIHSIEQPVQPGQFDLMKEICNKPMIPVALDEELIKLKGISKQYLLAQINPQYLILKPSMLGGMQACDEWIDLAIRHNVGWWATSALESNIGLNAIAQWVFTKHSNMVHGLGTGALYSNNVSSPLVVANGCLSYNAADKWGDL